MSVEIIRGAVPEQLMTAWSAAWQHHDAATVFCQPHWLNAWWTTLGRGADPYVLMLPQIGEAGAPHHSLAAVAPLCRRRGPAGPILRPAGEGVSDYTDWLLPTQPDQRHQSIELLADALVTQPDWMGLEHPGFRDVEDARLLEGALARRGVAVRLLRGLPCPRIEMPDGFDAYFRTRSSRFRYNVRSRRRRLEALGPVRFEHATADQAPRVIEQAMHLHRRRWQGQRTGTVFSSSAAGRAFYRASLPAAVGHEFGDIAVMTVNGGMVACAIAFTHGREYLYYLPAWHPGYHAYAPSTILLAHLVEHAAERGATTFDFMLGDEPYKDAWATGRHDVQTLLAARPTTAGRAWLAARIAAHQLKARLRESERVMAVRRYGLGALVRPRVAQS